MSLIRRFAIRNELLYSGFVLPNVQIFFVQKISFATFGVSIDDFFTRYAGLGYSLQCMHLLFSFTTTTEYMLFNLDITQINRGYLNFWNEYDIYFIEWSENCIFHEWRSHEWNIHFLASRDEINGIYIPKNWIFFLLYTILSVTDFLH